MRSEHRNSGYTLSQLLIAVFLICVLLALVFPAIQASREAARRTQCNYNLKNIGLGLQNYLDTYKVFPAGALHAGSRTAGDLGTDSLLGPSWYYGVFPFMECCDSFFVIGTTQRTGYPQRVEFCARDIRTVIPRLDRWIPDYMVCPSSPLPRTEKFDGPIALPSYVGLAGGCDIDPSSQDYAVVPVSVRLRSVVADNRIYLNAFKGTGAAAGGIVTSNGILPPGEHVSLAMCPDGLSNTLAVGEQSDWLRDRNPNSRAQYHGDAGWTVGGTNRGGGWISGTTRIGPVPRVSTPGRAPSPWGADYRNITTVRYPPNWKRVIGSPSLPGCSENHGINNPLQSAHPGGLLAAMADGSVQFIASTMDLEVLLHLAVRLDQQSLTPFGERGQSTPMPEAPESSQN